METQLTTGITRFEKFRFQPIKNALQNKPYGGLWSSTYMPKSKYCSDWIRFCRIEKFYTHLLNTGTLFNFKKNTRIFHINSSEDFQEFLDIIGKINVFDFPFETNLTYCINFEKASKYFDVIHLSKTGQLETKYISMIDFDISNTLNSWDCECCLTMNFDCIDLDSIKTIE